MKRCFDRFLDKSRCYLTIRHEDQAYIGVLRFDDSNFCKEISDLLEHYNGRAIHEIASMELGPSVEEFDSEDQ